MTDNRMYQLTGEGWVYRVDTDTRIPADEGCAGYREYLAWAAEGNAPLPQCTTNSLAPQVVTIRQARLALHQAGILDAVDAAVAQADKGTQIEWEYATEVKRNWPTLLVLQTALGLTDEQVDGLFILAGKI